MKYRKTSTVALLIRALVCRGQRVLVASYTHAAVDHLLFKLTRSGVDSSILLRLGSVASIDPKIQSYAIDPSHYPNLAALHSRVVSSRIVACTVLTAARHLLLQCVHFNWCIMDEAGQISQPAAIGPLLQAEKFLLVGDDYQLPPLVVSTEAKSMVQFNYAVIY